jgi:hypothetical protein
LGNKIAPAKMKDAAHSKNSARKLSLRIIVLPSFLF